MMFHIVDKSGLKIPICAPQQDGRHSAATLKQMIARDRKVMQSYLDAYGLVLFKGFDCSTVDHFSEIISACNLGSRGTTKDYQIARTLFANHIYTSSDLPETIAIPMHHEKPRSAIPPDYLYFCCNTAANQGGATLLANAADIWEHMPQTIQHKLLEHGVVYNQFLYANTVKSRFLRRLLGSDVVVQWQNYFKTSSKAQVEKHLQEHSLKYEWINGSHDLSIMNCLPGARIHPRTLKTLWFNSAAYLNNQAYLSSVLEYSKFHYKNVALHYLIAKNRMPLVCHYGDQSFFSLDEIFQINALIQSHTKAYYWDKGDVMIVDNYTMMHGKEPHQGNRLLYSCMTHI